MDVAAESESSGDRKRTRRKSDVARYVVGVAPAAGGEALEHMFDTMPDHSGMEFAIMPDGGLVVAAPPVQCASFDAMPSPAADTGLGDAVVGPSQHPEILHRSQEHPCPDQPQQAGQSLAIESGTDRRQQATNEELVASNEELQSTTQLTVIQEREQLARVIAANRDGVWDWPDVTQDNMWWSPGCYQLLGYAPGEFPARYSEWLRLIHPEDRQRVLETSVPAQNQCYVDLHRDFEYRMRHKSGEYCWYRHRAIVDYNSSGTPSRMTGSVGDVHDRKCAEMQNIEEIRRRDNFLAMLSHELRNPMGAVLNAIEWLKASSERQPGAQHFPWGETIAANEPADVSDHTAVRVIERQTKHMARLLDDLLDVTRFGQSKMELRKEIIDLSALVEDVLEAVQYEFEAKHQKLTTMVGDMPLIVLADPARIKQAQVNLLTNASKYTPDAGEISYHLEQDGHAAVITVRDAGEGIPRDLLDSIFDLFVQSETTLARSLGGIGAGLSLARSIVHAHEGSIVAESDGPGKGSAFRIRLSLAEQVPKTHLPAPHYSFHGCRLLLVEDNKDARTMLAKTLRLQGFDVVEAGEGRTALELYCSFQPNVAVIDIGLPVTDGYQLAREIRNVDATAETMLIALTGYGRQSDRQAAMDAGFDAHLVKPLNPAELYSVIAAKHIAHHDVA